MKKEAELKLLSKTVEQLEMYKTENFDIAAKYTINGDMWRVTIQIRETKRKGNYLDIMHETEYTSLSLAKNWVLSYLNENFNLKVIQD